MKTKADFRNHVKAQKRNYSLSEKKQRSIPIFKSLEKLEAFKNAQCVLFYWSMTDEVHTHEIVTKWYQEKTILLPSVHGADLKLKQFTGLENMEPGEGFGIGEPSGKYYTDYNNIDMIVVPGVAFDKQSNRLGRGRGYYDKLLQSQSAIKLGVCFDFQLFNTIPVDKHDIKMDLLISETWTSRHA